MRKLRRLVADPVSKHRTQQSVFFEHPGPLFSVRVSPASTTVGVGKQNTFRAVARDRAGHQVESVLSYQWRVSEGSGEINDSPSEFAGFTAPAEPQLVRLTVVVTQEEQEVSAEALVTVTDSLLPESPKLDVQRGLPDYTFEKCPGELLRSRYDLQQNLIVVNNRHRDFVHASRSKIVKLRYVCRLFVKELVQHNFPGCSTDQLLERMIELLLYAEENLGWSQVQVARTNLS